MKKYFLLIAVAVLGLTACENDIKREPSPEFGKNVAAFADTKIVVDINPVKAALEYGVELVRSNPEEALTVGIEVLDGDKDIISVPATVSFAAKEASTTLLLSFPSAKMDKSYSIVIGIKNDNQSPYLDGNPKLEFTVNIASWEPAATQAIVFDGLVGAMYGVDVYGWYVNYQKNVKADGSFDVRLLNPYASYATGDADQFGFFDGYPYNAASEVLEGDYPWILHIAADNTVTFDDFKMGMLWSADYGEFSAGLTEGASGTYDPELEKITFPGGAAWATMANLTKVYTWDDQDLVIYLNATAYQNDHLSIEDFNDPTIEWEEVATEMNVFQSEIFAFVSENQKLYQAVDPLEDNPKSPYKQLFCLKDVYAEGGNLAFYWDQETDEIVVPSMQNTKISFMGRELYIYEGMALKLEDEIKGVPVTQLLFAISVITLEGDYVGDFMDQFSFSTEPIIYEKADFLGNFILTGESQFAGYPAAQMPVEIKEEKGAIYLFGMDLVDTLQLVFDDEAGEMYFFPQQVGNIIHPQVGEMTVLFLTTTPSGDVSTKEPMILGFTWDGLIRLAKSSGADGYLIRGTTLDGSAGGWLDGYYDIGLTRVAGAAPARTGAYAPMNIFPLTQKVVKHVNRHEPSTDHLHFNGKIDRRPLRENVF